MTVLKRLRNPTAQTSFIHADKLANRHSSTSGSTYYWGLDRGPKGLFQGIFHEGKPGDEFRRFMLAFQIRYT